MSVPFPNYFEFPSINPAYQLDPDTKIRLTCSWGYMTHDEDIAKKAPEGLLIPNGVLGIQKRMAEVRYIAVVPRELAEEVRQIIEVRINIANPRMAQRLPSDERGKFAKYPMQECLSSIKDERLDERTDDPFPELPCPWPWKQGRFRKPDRPFSGPIRGLFRGRIVDTGSRLINYIYAYDYCGQYFGSADTFCRYMDRIPGSKNYSATLRALKDCIQSNGDASLIVICPENIVSSLSKLKVPDNLYSEPWEIPYSQYDFGLKKVLLHEMGHHMFPVFTFESNWSVYWPECMANWFAYHYLDRSERFILHMWSLKQPIQYQCYKALLGLSMRNGSHEFLSILPLSLRSEFIIEVEKLCGYNEVVHSFSHLGAKGQLYFDPYYVSRLQQLCRDFYKKPDTFNVGHPVLFTHSEVLFQLLIYDDQYLDLFTEFQDMISEGKIRARRATKGEYHLMLLNEGELNPISVGSTRRE